MARMKYAERNKLATEWKTYCKVTGLLPTTERFVDWLERVKDILLMSLDDRQKMVREAVEIERVAANAPKPEGGPQA